jgi:hypothetical protein
MSPQKQYRSVFWPILLIGVGLLWLMNNLNLLPGWSWGTLWQLWPIFLIAIGLDLLIARRSAILGAIVALATIGLVVVVVLAGTTFNVGRDPDVITEQFSEALGSTNSARIDLEFSIGPAFIEALDGSEDLIQAEITHLGEIEFSSSGTSRKTILLDTIERSFQVGRLDLFDERKLRWEIGITPEIPIELDIRGGVGEADLDLSELNLTSLDLDVGVGQIKIYVPATPEGYNAQITGSVGETYIEIEDGADIHLDIDGGVGEVTIKVPADAAARLDASIGVGRVRVPSSFQQISGGDNNFVGEEGVWETPGFNTAERRIIINFHGSVGGLIVR